MIVDKYTTLEMVNGQVFNEPGTKQQMVSRQLIRDMDDIYMKYDEDFENVHGVISATREKVTYVQDGKLAKIVPDDGTAPTTFTSSSSSSLILTELKSFKRKYDEDDKVKATQLKAMNKKLKLLQTTVNRGNLCNRSPSVNKTGSANLRSLRDVGTIHSIWEEYKYGNSGNKAVELLTKMEMRMEKHKWSLRNNAILALKLIISKGVDIHTACDRLRGFPVGNFWQSIMLTKYWKRLQRKQLIEIF